jgi:hypothetical protein
MLDKIITVRNALLMPGVYKETRIVPRFPKLTTATYRINKVKGRHPVTTEEFQVVRG